MAIVVIYFFSFFPSHFLYVIVTFFDKHFVLQVCDRATSCYVTFSKDYPKCIYSLRSLQKKGVDFSHVEIDPNQIYQLLGAPLARLGMYGIELSSVFTELDSFGRKCLMPTMKSIDSLSRKCNARAFQKIYT